HGLYECRRDHPRSGVGSRPPPGPRDRFPGPDVALRISSAALGRSGLPYLARLQVSRWLRALLWSAAVARSISDTAAVRDGTINNLTNPKALAFLFAFLPQFVDPASAWPVALQLLLLGVVTKLSNFAILSTVALGAGTCGRWLARRPGLIAWQERFAGVVMVGLGLRLALSGDIRPAR